MGVNSLPKTVTRHRHDCDLNPGPSAPESNTVTTGLYRATLTIHRVKDVAESMVTIRSSFCGYKLARRVES